MQLLTAEHEMLGEITTYQPLSGHWGSPPASGRMPRPMVRGFSSCPLLPWQPNPGVLVGWGSGVAGPWLSLWEASAGSTGTVGKQPCSQRTQRARQIFTLCFNPDLFASQDK